MDNNNTTELTPEVTRKATFTSFLVGLIFAFGLGISGMTLPSKVIGFLDVTGKWDPSLAFVMGSALLVYAVAYRIAEGRVSKQEAPTFGLKFGIPRRRDITWELVIGSMLFGMGWGLGGFCPGPAIVSLSSLAPNVFLFVISMTLGMVAQTQFQRWLARRADEQ